MISKSVNFFRPYSVALDVLGGTKAIEEGRLFPSQKVATRGSNKNLCFKMGEHQVM